MSTRPHINPTIVINSGSMASSITSLVTLISFPTLVCYSVYWSGTSPVGTLSVEVSGDYALNPNGTLNNAGHWSAIELNVNGTTATSIAVSGNTGVGSINLADFAPNAVRLIYTAASGVGNLTALINAKVY